MLTVLIVGQTPPPFGGQAIMIDKIIKGNYSKLNVVHCKLSFSKEMDDIGKFQINKIWHLISVVSRITLLRIKHKPSVLYYPPAGPDKIPMYRDFVTLICTRWMFKKTVFHFHAGGVSTLYKKLNSVGRFLFRTSYYNPDGSILLSSLNPRDGEAINSKQNFVIPYGIEDHFEGREPELGDVKTRLLFMSILKESKGLLVFLDALKHLKLKNKDFEAKIVGRFESNAFEQKALAHVSKNDLDANVDFLGVLTGDEKWRQFSRANIFCYPTFFESETFGLVVLEAMQFSLPTVVSSWRGVPSLVEDGDTGFIVPIKDAEKLAEKIEVLLDNPELSKKMGAKGRDSYLENYSLQVFHERIESALLSVANS